MYDGIACTMLLRHGWELNWVSNMTKPSAFYFGMQVFFCRNTTSRSFLWFSVAHPLAALPLDKLILLHCSQRSCSSAQAAETLRLHTETDSEPSGARKVLVEHLARWEVDNSNLFPELFSETIDLCLLLLPAWTNVGIAARSKMASVLSFWRRVQVLPVTPREGKE